MNATYKIFVWFLVVLAIATGTLNAQDKSISGRRTNAGPKNNSRGVRLAAFEYAKMIEPELGVPPVVDCGEGVEIPIYVDGKKFQGDPGIHCCDNPSLQMGDCMSGSSLQRYEGKTRDGKALPHVVWVSFARHDGRENIAMSEVANSVQLIGYNKKTGATAFFEGGDNRQWVRVDPETNRLVGKLPGIDNPRAFNRAYATPQNTQCVQCHQNDPFIHNPFIDAAKLPDAPTETVVPRLAGPDSPYYVIGASHWDMRTIHIEGNSCLECHRIGMKTVEEFVGDGWNPNEHMPPHAPGSMREDFEELIAAWQNGPENTLNCDWIIPPAGDAPRRIVGEDYPHKAEFNKPDHSVLARLYHKPRKIPEPKNFDLAKAKQMQQAWLTEQLSVRFLSEIAERTNEENRAELETLKRLLRQATEEGNDDRTHILSVEIKLIEEAINNKPNEDAQALGGSGPMDGRWHDGTSVFEADGDSFMFWEQADHEKPSLVGRIEFRGDRFAAYNKLEKVTSGKFRRDGDVLYIWRDNADDVEKLIRIPEPVLSSEKSAAKPKGS